jgi:hypothetical protein
MIKKILLSSLLLTITVVFFSGCKKDTISPTQAEITANELRSVIERNAISRVYPVRINQPLPTPFAASGGTSWTFSNGFIYINNSSFYDGYNLTYLVRYGIANVPLSNNTSDKALLLYMEQ